MLLISILIFLIYSTFAIWLIIGLSKSKNQKFSRNSTPKTYFSILIAAHNEEKVIGETLQRLLNQNYPESMYEIIVAADRCTDRTNDIVKQMSRKVVNLSLIEIDKVESDISPKKNAIGLAIREAKYDNFILMDADSFADDKYLVTLDNYFTAGYEVIVNIPKPFKKSHILNKYLLPERLFAWSIAAAGIGYRKPFLAFGTSWAYSRKLFDAVDGFQSIFKSLSGDDDLLIYSMGKLDPKMVVCLQPDGWVKTPPPESWKAFFYQRRRHHSAGKFYSPGVKFGYATYHLSQIALWILPLFYWPAVFALILKFLIDSLVLQFSSRIFKEKLTTLNYLVFEIGYLFHYLIIAPMGFVGKVRWKGK